MVATRGACFCTNPPPRAETDNESTYTKLPERMLLADWFFMNEIRGAPIRAVSPATTTAPPVDVALIILVLEICCVSEYP